ncbi:hypothetical protein DXG01_007392 [Tephrocybe rancida]|nr:hypothetical protein DXG01_007392 [Tephrocybe rancida]
MKTLLSSGSRPTPSRVSFLETDVGVATLILLRVLETEGPITRSPFFEGVQFCLRTIRAAVDSVSNSEEDACEVLYGRAGLLYALLRIHYEVSRAQAPGLDSNDQERMRILCVLETLTDNPTLASVIGSIIDIGKEGARQYIASRTIEPGTSSPRLMWSWHGKRYLGAAHGVAGILFVLWSCPFSVLEPYADDLLQTLAWLVDVQDPTGNWPSKAPDNTNTHARPNKLIQWCHGASGILILLSKASQQRSGLVLDKQVRQKVNAAIAKGARIVYRHGLLTKGVGICHGVAGSALDVLGGTLNDETADYLRKALHLALLAVDYKDLTKNGKIRVPDHPWSLYEGAAGMCCAWSGSWGQCGQLHSKLADSQIVSRCRVEGMLRHCKAYWTSPLRQAGLILYNYDDDYAKREAYEEGCTPSRKYHPPNPSSPHAGQFLEDKGDHHPRSEISSPKNAAIAIAPIKEVAKLEQARDNDPNRVESRKHFPDATNGDGHPSSKPLFGVWAGRRRHVVGEETGGEE